MDSKFSILTSILYRNLSLTQANKFVMMRNHGLGQGTTNFLFPDGRFGPMTLLAKIDLHAFYKHHIYKSTT